MSQEVISAFLAVSLFGSLFYVSIFPFLNDKDAAQVCRNCSSFLTRYGWCPTCLKKTRD